MTVIFTLLVLAVIFFLVEFIVPGGFLAVISMVLIFAAALLAYRDHGATAGALVFTGGISFAAFMLYLEIRFLRRSVWGKKWFQHHDVNATHTGMLATEDLVGQAGVALTAMSPSGKVQIGDKIYPAASLDGFLAKGTPVVVRTADPALIRVSTS